MAVTIRKDRILDNWLTIIDNGAGNQERIYTTTEEYLENAQLPGVTLKRDQVNSGMFGRGREFLIVSHRVLTDYTMFIYARDYGQHLDCGWYLLCKPGMFKKAISRYAAGNPNSFSMNLDVFDQQDLSAWTHVIHRTFLRAVKELMEELELDITGMNTRSKGYLSVW